MPEFIAVQCYQCGMFQSMQKKKKSRKWNCKVCHEKQSLKKVYATSTKSKDIRSVVMRLNMAKGQREQAVESIDDDEELEAYVSPTHLHEDVENRVENGPAHPETSQWARFLPETVSNEEDDDQNHGFAATLSRRAAGQLSLRHALASKARSPSAGGAEITDDSIVFELDSLSRKKRRPPRAKRKSVDIAQGPRRALAADRPPQYNDSHVTSSSSARVGTTVPRRRAPAAPSKRVKVHTSVYTDTTAPLPPMLHAGQSLLPKSRRAADSPLQCSASAVLPPCPPCVPSSQPPPASTASLSFGALGKKGPGGSADHQPVASATFVTVDELDAIAHEDSTQQQQQPATNKRPQHTAPSSSSSSAGPSRWNKFL